MTDLEKLEARKTSIDLAIDAVRSAISTDRKLSHSLHSNGHLTNSLSELHHASSGLANSILRMKTLGR